MLYVSDMHTYLQINLGDVLQHVKSEQGRYLQCVGKTRVSVVTYVNVCNVIRHWHAYIPHVKSEQVVPSIVLRTHVFLLILMSMLYISDTHTNLEGVPQHVKSEGRSLQCFGRTRVSVNTYINVCNVIRPRYAYTSWCCACYSSSKVNKVVLAAFWESMWFCRYLCKMLISQNFDCTVHSSVCPPRNRIGTEMH